MRYPKELQIGTGGETAKNHAICDGPVIVAHVLGAGYPAGGKGWAPQTEALAADIVRRWNAFDELQAIVAEVSGALCDAVADLEGWGSSGPEGMTLDEKDRMDRYQEIIDETAKKLAAYLT